MSNSLRNKKRAQPSLQTIHRDVFLGGSEKPAQRRKNLRTLARPKHAMPSKAEVEAASGALPLVPVAEHQALGAKTVRSTRANETL